MERNNEIRELEQEVTKKTIELLEAKVRLYDATSNKKELDNVLCIAYVKFSTEHKEFIAGLDWDGFLEKTGIGGIRAGEAIASFFY